MKYLDEDSVTLYNGDCLEVLKDIQNDSVDCVITSPPYYQLRKYSGIPDYVWGGDKSCEHDWSLIERKPIGGSGSNGNVGANKNDSANMRDGSVFSNICSKCGAWKGQLGLEPTYRMYLDHMIAIMSELARVLKPSGTMWINLGDSYSGSGNGTNDYRTEKSKSISGKGFDYNKLIQAKQTDENKKLFPSKSLMLIPHRFAIRCVDELGLILRNDIIWAKRNGMPESVTDRFSKKHEFIFFFVKGQKYYFDLDSVRGKHKPESVKRNEYGLAAYQDPMASRNREFKPGDFLNENGKNPGDVSDFWDIPTRPSSAKHYATYNNDLIDKPIIAGCPEGGIILDPFCGTGTTIARATQLGRRGIGIDGSSEYCKIAKERISQKELF